MKSKYLFILLLLVIFSMTVVSAHDVNQSDVDCLNQVDLVCYDVNQSDVDCLNQVDLVCYDVNQSDVDCLNQVDLVCYCSNQVDDINVYTNGFVENNNYSSLENDSLVVYVGQNITEDGGNGSKENPFSSLDLACANVNGEDKVTVNIFNGTYYIGSDLAFNTNNLNINGMGGDVIIKNLYNVAGTRKKMGSTQSIKLVSSSANVTFSNIIYDASEWELTSGPKHWFYLFTGSTNYGLFYNVTFRGIKNNNVIVSSINRYNFTKCIFDFNGRFSSTSTGSIMLSEQCSFNECVILSQDFFTLSSNKYYFIEDNWYGQNNLPDYLKIYDSEEYYPIIRYAMFTIYENCINETHYEIIGKLCWNGTNDVVGDVFAPMTVALNSTTGNIQTEAILENGIFRVVYASNSSDNVVTATLNHEIVNLNFTNVDFQVDAPTIFYGQDQNITITLPQATNSTINVTVNNKTYEVEVNDSTSVTFTVPEVLKEGAYVVVILLRDTENHIYGSNSTELVVSKVSDYAFVPIVPSDAKVGDTVTINIELPSDATGDVSVIVGENTFNKTASANVEIDITGLVAGDNNIKLVYSGDDKYTNKSSESIITAEKVEVELNNNTLNVEVPQNAVNPNFSIVLPSDATGNLTVIINNKTYTQELVNGNATINVDDLTPGDYNATVTYSGDGKYYAITTTASLTVPKVEVPIKNDTLVAETPKGTTTPSFTIALPSDATGNLTVTIKGKDYTKKLVNGSATITINDLNPGKYDAIVTYSGDSKYDSITSNATVSIPKPVLTSKNFAMLYTSGTKYTVRVTVDGKAVSGKTVTFTINGKKTTAKTDKNGYASVKITLPPKAKAYTVTATYLGVKVTNKVTVKSIVVAKNLKAKKSAKTLKIKVTLKKVNKKYLKGKTVSLKFKGKTYKVKTNKKGVATFTIKKNVLSKLKVGKKYSYKVTYGKDVVSKKITVKK